METKASNEKGTPLTPGTPAGEDSVDCLVGGICARIEARIEKKKNQIRDIRDEIANLEIRLIQEKERARNKWIESIPEHQQGLARSGMKLREIEAIERISVYGDRQIDLARRWQISPARAAQIVRIAFCKMRRLEGSEAAEAFISANVRDHRCLPVARRVQQEGEQ